MSKIIFNQGATPSDQAVGATSLYTKTDGKVYAKDAANQEMEMIVLSGGFCGIGHTAPPEALTVAGSVSAESIKWPDGTEQTTAFTSASGEYGGGKVVQVVQSVNGPQDIGMSSHVHYPSQYVVSITPTLATSKVLVSFAGKARGASSQFSQYLYSETASTSAIILSAGWSDHSSYGQGTNIACQFLHSPATTSEISYKLYFSAAGGTVQVGMEGPNIDIVGIAMEIGA